MHIDDKLLNRLENLAHLKIDESKRAEVESNLSDILDFVENLSELDTENVSEKFSMEGKAIRLRADVPCRNEEVFPEVLKNAPSSTETFFKVPKIIE